MDDLFNEIEGLREIVATLVKRLGGQVTLRQADQVGPYEMRHVFARDKATGERVLVIQVDGMPQGTA